MLNIQLEIKRNTAYTKTLNVSGRQRMLSQKLTRYAYEASEGRDVYTYMSSSIELWKQSHIDLLNSNKGLSIYMDDHPEIKDSFNNITPVYNELLQTFTDIAENRIIPDSQLLKSINASADDYLNKMDGIVSRLEMNATSDLAASEKKQSILALLSGLFLVIEMIVFIYPYHKRLINAYKKVKRQQEELEAQNNLIESLYETNDLIIKGTNSGIWEWNVVTGAEDWSDRFFKLLGYDRGDITPAYDTFLNVLMHPDDKTKILSAVDQHLKNGTPYKHEIRMLNKNGNYRWYETSGQAIWDDEGNAIRMAGSIIDITGRIATREKLLSESNTKDKLLSIITHDLRSPVNNLKSLLELLSANIINKEEFTNHLETITKNVASLSGSMDNMLTWAQSQLKGWEVNPAEMLIDDAILESVRLYKTVIDNKQIALKFQPTELIKVYADYNQIMLIIRNMLNNAIKFTPEKGTISIETIHDGDYVNVVVKDSGCGMDQSTIDRVLNRNEFYTTNGTNGEKGTGLGMNMCLDFAEKNNCSFTIKSQLGEGTTVYLKIPVAV